MQGRCSCVRSSILLIRCPQAAYTANLVKILLSDWHFRYVSWFEIVFAGLGNCQGMSVYDFFGAASMTSISYLCACNCQFPRSDSTSPLQTCQRRNLHVMQNWIKSFFPKVVLALSRVFEKCSAVRGPTKRYCSTNHTR